MTDFDKYIEEASSNVGIENKIDEKVKNKIEEALLIAKETGKSFFTSLYELLEAEKNETKGNNRK